MSDAFDPYYTWLSIPPAEQPPNHYRLLGLPLYEANADVIANAADRQMAHLRSAAGGKRAAQSQQLLNEVAAAQVCLLDAAKKRAYDDRLRAEIAARRAADDAELRLADEPRSAASVAIPPVALPTLRPRTTVAARRRKSSFNAPMLIGGGAVLVTAIVVAIVLLGGSGDGDPVADAADRGAHPPKSAENRTAKRPEKRSDQPAAPPIAKPEMPNPPPDASVVPSSTNDEPASPEASPAKPDDATPVSPADIPADPRADANPPTPTDGEPEPNADPPPKSDAQPEPPSTPAESAPMPRTLEPLPAEEALAAAEKEIRDVYREALVSRNPETERQLAKKLLDSAREPKESSVNRYVLARMAADLAAGVVDLPTALAAVDLLAESFEIDSPELKRQALLKAGKSTATPDALKTFLASAMEVCRRAVAADDFALAKAALDAISPAARRANDRATTAEVARLAKELPRLEREYAKVATALAMLAADANDAVANLAVGKYRCFLKGDWEAGLPLLVKGGDDKLKALAEEDLKAAEANAEAKAAAADAWWAYAEKAPTVDKPNIQRRAAWWYQQALPELSGLARTKAQQRLRQVGVIEPPGLAEALVGHWRLDDGGPVVRDSVGQRNGSAKNVAWVRDGSRTLLVHNSKSAVEFPPLEFGEKFSVAIWAKPAADSKNIKTLISTRASGGPTNGRGFALFINSWNTTDRCLLIESTGDGTSYASTPKDTATLGEWMHVAMTVDRPAGKAKIYVNGKDATTGASFPRNLKDGGVWRVGSFLPGGAAHGFDGPLGDLRVYGRELTADEVLFLATIAGI